MVYLVKEYIEYHEKNGEKVPLNPEEVAGPDVWKALTEKEQRDRKAGYDKEITAIKKHKEEEKAVDIKDFHKKKGNDQSQFLLDV